MKNKFIILIWGLFIFTLGLSAQHAQVDEKGKVYWMHPIEKNEQLHHIAQLYAIDIITLKEYNNLVDNNIDGLKYIKVPIAIQKSSKLRPKGKYVLHKVQSGEQMHTLASKYNTDLQKLKLLNWREKNLLKEGEYILVPNTLPTNTAANRLTMTAYLSLGFFSGRDWTEENKTSYNIRSRFNLQNVYVYSPFRNVTRFQTGLGYRHEIGQRIYKNIDLFSLRNQMEWHFHKGWAIYTLGSIRSQYMGTNFYREDGSQDLISAFMAPGYTNVSFGLVYVGDFIDLDIGLFEQRNVHVLQDKVYGERDAIFGVPRGDKIFSVRGVSIRADIDYYKSEKFNVLSNFFVFANKDLVTTNFRGELNYRPNKVLRFTFLLEMNYDKAGEYSSFQYRTEALIGVGFYKK